MDLVALDRASESVSSSQALNPCMAASWAIPEPIWPPPTTAMVLISAIHAPLPPWQMLAVCVCVCWVRRRSLETLDWAGSKPADSLDNFDLCLNRKGMSQGLITWFGLI